MPQAAPGKIARALGARGSQNVQEESLLQTCDYNCAKMCEDCIVRGENKIMSYYEISHLKPFLF